jgi:hypothetical protein
MIPGKFGGGRLQPLGLLEVVRPPRLAVRFSPAAVVKADALGPRYLYQRGVPGLPGATLYELIELRLGNFDSLYIEQIHANNSSRYC